MEIVSPAATNGSMFTLCIPLSRTLVKTLVNHQIPVLATQFTQITMETFRNIKEAICALFFRHLNRFPTSIPRAQMVSCMMPETAGLQWRKHRMILKHLSYTTAVIRVTQKTKVKWLKYYQTYVMYILQFCKTL